MMRNMFKKTKSIWIIMVILLVMIAIVGEKNFIESNKTISLIEIEYRTDIEPLIKRFGNTISIETCFWKSNIIGNSKLGPSSYWMKGYAFVSSEDADFLKSKYNFISVDISFEKGITPDITGKNEFKWSYNKELSRKLTGAQFIGEFYFDIENNIFYFDLESV